MNNTANKVRRMTKRRALTAQEKIAQQNLRALWNAHKKALGLTQEKAAHQLGWSSQGTVGQYLLGRVPLNTDALLKFAKLLDVKPTDIDPDFQWGDITISMAYGSGKTNTDAMIRNFIEGSETEQQASTSAEIDVPKHVRDLVDIILKKARDGSLTKEHTAVLKSSLELMTGGKK